MQSGGLQRSTIYRLKSLGLTSFVKMILLAQINAVAIQPVFVKFDEYVIFAIV